MTIIFTMAILTGLVMLWAAIIRPWLRNKLWAQGFFKKIEPIERFYKKSEQIALARWYQFAGLVLIATGYLGGIEWSIVYPFLPESMHKFVPLIPIFLNVIGSVAEKMRGDTTKPIELVDIPQNAPVEVKVVEAKVALAVAEAREVIAEKKAEGAM